MHALGGLIGRAALLTGACMLVGVIFNALRPSEGIALVAPRPYEIYVPCPETQTEAESISAEDLASQQDILYVDARPEVEFDRFRIKGAVSVPYPLLDEPMDEEAAALKRRAVPIVTYGSGGRGDLGEMLASLLTELGVPEVSHLEGGLPAWRAQGGEIEGDPGGEGDGGPAAEEEGAADAAADGTAEPDGGEGGTP